MNFVINKVYYGRTDLKITGLCYRLLNDTGLIVDFFVVVAVFAVGFC